MIAFISVTLRTSDFPFVERLIESWVEVIRQQYEYSHPAACTVASFPWIFVNRIRFVRNFQGLLRGFID